MVKVKWFGEKQQKVFIGKEKKSTRPEKKEISGTK